MNSDKNHFLSAVIRVHPRLMLTCLSYALVRVWPGDRPCVCPCGGTGAQVKLGDDGPAPRGEHCAGSEDNEKRKNQL